MKKIMFNDRYGLTEAVLSGRKTQTRRIVPQSTIDKYALLEDPTIIDDARYDAGDVVAIAQSYESVYNEIGLETIDLLISGIKHHKGWSNKLFVRASLMPHHIRITNVRVERLQDISDEDCIKEGIFVGTSGITYHAMNLGICANTPREAYAALIDRISGKGTWDSNPYVFVYDFELVD